MITTLVVRRFSVRHHDATRNVEVARPLDLPAVPFSGVVLDFGDGTPPAAVTTVRFVCYPSPRDPGLYPPGIEVRTATEPGERLDEALSAAWVPLEPGAGRACSKPAS